MSGLVLKLGPKERIMINGVVMENGDRRTRLNILSPNANVLRMRDAIHPSEVKTPVKRVCYIAQLVLAGEADPDDGREQIIRGIAQLKFAFNDPPSLEHLDKALESVRENRFYQTLKALKAILPREEALLSRAAVAAEGDRGLQS